MLVKKIIYLLLLTSFSGYTQCAMCKAVVENGETNYAKGLNDGIVTLMMIPYILVIIVGIVFWKYYQKNKKHVGKS